MDGPRRVAMVYSAGLPLGCLTSARDGHLIRPLPGLQPVACLHLWMFRRARPVSISLSVGLGRPLAPAGPPDTG